MKGILALIIVVLSVGFAHGQNTDEVQIKISAECGSCKERIEGKLNYTAGIKFAELDVRSKVLTVKYSKKKLSLDDIKKMVSEIGYDADEVKAVPTSVEALPTCCKPGGMEKK